MDSIQTKPTRILLLTHARTASHLLERMLSKQTNCLYSSHFFHAPTRVLRREFLKQMATGQADQDLKVELLAKYDEGYRDYENFLNEAKRLNKIAFDHLQPHVVMTPTLAAEQMYGREFRSEDEHFWLVGQPKNSGKAHTTRTVLPDENFLQPGTRVIITFRHPVLIIEGMYRGFLNLSEFAQDMKNNHRMLHTGGTLRYVRMMYDWYLEHGKPLGIEPIVVEADDYMGSEKQSVMEDLCKRAGLDADQVIYSWPKVPDEEIAKLTLAQAQSFQTINSSEGILSGKSSAEMDLDKEMQSWDERFGKEGATLMRDLVAKAMPDYEYMRAARSWLK